MSWVKFGILVVFVVFFAFLINSTTFINLFNGGINYITNSVIGSTLTDIFHFISNSFDDVIFHSSTNFSIYGYNVGNFVWVGTIAGICVFVFVFNVIINLIFRNRG